jgi:hypothetical protein
LSLVPCHHLTSGIDTILQQAILRVNEEQIPPDTQNISRGGEHPLSDDLGVAAGQGSSTPDLHPRQ